MFQNPSTIAEVAHRTKNFGNFCWVLLKTSSRSSEETIGGCIIETEQF